MPIVMSESEVHFLYDLDHLMDLAGCHSCGNTSKTSTSNCSRLLKVMKQIETSKVQSDSVRFKEAGPHS